MAEVKATRKVCSKAQYSKAVAEVLREFGVCFKDGKKVVQSRAKYWDLVRILTNLNMAITASCGANVSLSGLGIYTFSLAGRTEETRTKRFKTKISSALAKQFRENPSLIQDTPNLEGEDGYDEAKFMSDVRNVMAALGTPVGANAEIRELNCDADPATDEAVDVADDTDDVDDADISDDEGEDIL